MTLCIADLLSRAQKSALRDQFAAAALTGILAGSEFTSTHTETGRNAAALRAYQWADAMFKARSAHENENAKE
jgi:hypothetical protein